ncbi:MAG: LPS assembly lipoprotein LptE [Alphaproteobacteria bacterium]|nr:LPS assembly lipoprotein LptE [Alphaproteobacteria bacterium]
MIGGGVRRMVRLGFAGSRGVLLSALLAAVALSGCGFQPLYAKRTGESTAYNQGFPEVDVAQIPDRLGQILHNELLDRINPRGVAPRPRYRLEISASERRSDIVILRDSTATFAKFIVEARWRLIDLSSGESVTEGTNQRTSSFSISSSEYAILQAEKDARQRAATELAEDISLRLALFFDRLSG